MRLQLELCCDIFSLIFCNCVDHRDSMLQLGKEDRMKN